MLGLGSQRIKLSGWEAGVLTVNSATRVCIQNAHVTTPNTLPGHISPLNQPWSSHTRYRYSSCIFRQRQNMVPPPTAPTQNAAICARRRYHAHQTPHCDIATPQLAYVMSSRVCSDLLNAVVHASAHNVDDIMACNSGCGEL